MYVLGVAEPARDPAGDLALLVEACASELRARTLEAVRRVAGEQVRASDGYVFQHLTAGPRSISELAVSSGVTQQAMSKQVADLERRGLVERQRNPDDARVSWIRLSARGNQAVDAARTARRELFEEAEDAVGAAAMDHLMQNLGLLSDHLGALDSLLERRLRPDSEL